MKNKDLQSGWHLLLTLLTLLSGTACASSHPLPGVHAPRAVQRQDCPRVLVLLVDAVPFHVVAETGIFQDLHGPWPLISTFPSSTSIAMVGIFQTLGLEPSPGYEARFYDARAGRVLGGGPRSYQQIPFPWRDGFFHWKTQGTWNKAIGYSHPLKFGRQEAHQLMEAFLASDQPLFLAYVVSTDAAGHLKGPAALTRVLRDLEEELAEVRQRSPEPFRVVILSDHGLDGGEPLANTIGPLRQALRRDGFRPGKRVRGPGEVAVVALGLLSSLALGTHPGEEIRVAQTAAAVPGIALCVARQSEDEDRWRVESATGGAWIERRGDAWRYLIDTGDPLDYGSVLQRLAADQEWFSDRQWLAATRDHQYPDALARLADAFSLVTHPASVVCSLKDGFMFGPRHTAFASRLTKGPLRWTHGALDRGDTLGFLVTDIDGWTEEPMLRAKDALAPLLPLLDPLADSAVCPFEP